MPWKYLHRRKNAYLINLSMLQESSPLQADALFKDTFDDLCLDVPTFHIHSCDIKKTLLLSTGCCPLLKNPTLSDI